MRYILLLFVLQSDFYGDYRLFENKKEWELYNNYMSICISKINGNITAIIMKNKNLLSNANFFRIKETNDELHGEILKTSMINYDSGYIEIYIKKFWGINIIECRYKMDSIGLFLDIEVTNKNAQTKEMNIDIFFPLISSMSHFFYPASRNPLFLENLEFKELIYRKNFLIPVIVLYNPQKDYGLSIIAPIEIPRPAFSVSFDTENLIVSHNYLRTNSNKKFRAAIYIIPHGGDWHEGLNFLLNKYVDYFQPRNNNTKIGEGWYAASRPFNIETDIKKMKRQCVKWTEFTDFFPFLGLYIPHQKDWAIIFNTDKVSLNEWFKGVGELKTSYGNITNLINLCHKYGIQVYPYFQAFEAWHQYAEKYFVDDITRDKNGNPLPAWKFCNLMNPDPKGKWGRYIINQAKELVKKYPEIDGIFYDRMDYHNYDFAHNDDVTMIDGKPAYMLGFALEKINEKIFDIFHKKGKAIWGNGPTSIEVCKNLDGIMAEGSLRNLYKLQYLALVRPLIYLPYDKTPKETEEKLKHSLICGAFPSITYGGSECQKLDEKYRPLFELIRNRKWVLTSNPIEVPDQFRVNIFQTPDSNYVVVIISPEKSQLVPHPFEYNIPVTINLPDAKEIKNAYLLSGDWTGVNSLEFKKFGNSISINLPWHLSGSLIYLTKKNGYEPFILPSSTRGRGMTDGGITRLSSPILIKGDTSVIIFKIEDEVHSRRGSVELVTPWIKQSKPVISGTVKFEVMTPNNVDGEIPVEIKYSNEVYKMSFWIVEPVSFTPTEDIFLQSEDGNISGFYFSNNLNQNLAIYPKGDFISGAGKIESPKKIMLNGHETKRVYFVVSSKLSGKIAITFNIKSRKIIKEFPIKIGLFRSFDDLFYDDFKEGMKKWAINRGKWDVSNSIAQGSGLSHFAFIKNNDWQDYVFEVKTRCQGSDDPAVDWLKSYVFFRLQDEKNFYRFGIHGGYEMISLYKCVNGNWFELAKAPFSAQPNRWYTIKIEVKQDKISGYLNGEVIMELKDNTFLHGGIGIGVLEDGMITDYRDIIVKKL